MISIIAIENHRDAMIDALCEKYAQRTRGPFKLNIELLPAARVKNPEQQKQTETSNLLRALKTGDTLILCDEKGKNFDSISFSEFVVKQLSQSRGRLVFAIGGAYGFAEELLQKNQKIQLSSFTFPHQLARLILAEQLYRAFEISRGSGYHHE